MICLDPGERKGVEEVASSLALLTAYSKSSDDDVLILNMMR